ncbi:SCO family protein [Flavobacteriaceae bacterium]|nr:SCO family protein [Flavobacteriaceae bacterium]
MKVKYIIGMCLTVLMLSCKEQKAKVVTIDTDELPYFNDADLTPTWEKDVKKHKVANFKLVNQLGDSIAKKDYEGKIYVSHFFFTSCTGICSRLIKNMSILQENFKGDTSVKFLSHSVTPVLDSVARLKTYADYHKINSDQWNLVTGSKDEIYELARTSYFSDDDYNLTKKPSTFVHSENFLLIDPKGHIRGVYNGTLKLEMARITEHINRLKKEFSTQ